MKRVTILGLVAALSISVKADLVHRYDFATDGVVNDTVGSADGALYGNAVVSGGALTTADAYGTASSGTVANGAQLASTAVAGITGSFTIESWVSATLFSNHRFATAWAFSDGTIDNYLQSTPARNNAGYPSAIGIKGAGGVAGEQLMTAPFWDNGEVHQIIATYDGTTASYYVDGVLKSSVTDVGFNLSTLGVIGINGGSPYNDYSITGSTHDFRIYNQGLSADQVSSLYTLGADASNTSISKAIPEPAVLGFVALSGLSFLFIRRFFMK